MTTLISILEKRLSEEPHKEFLRIWTRKNESCNYSYLDLYEEAKKYAQFFKNQNIKPGDRIIIMLLTRIEFFYIFFGVIMAGGIPVPVHPPIFILDWEEYKEKFLHIFRTSSPKLIICYNDVFNSINDKVFNKKAFTQILTLEEMKIPEANEGLNYVHPSPNDCAYIQYTSGSTGLPKGVALSHSALINNTKSIGGAFELTEKDIVVSWLPLYHDMGLIGGFFTILYSHCTVCLIPTEYFVMQPITLFKIVSDNKATIISSSNFGYTICNKYVNHKKMSNIDLSSLRATVIGSDHVQFDDMEEFIEKFKDYKLKENIFLPVYGFAETCLGAAISKPNSPIKLEYIDPEILNKQREAVISQSKNNSVRVMAVGNPIEGQEVKVIDKDGAALPDGMLGEICLRGNMLLMDYISSPGLRHLSMKNGWFLTGDLGYVREGSLFFFERKKDLLTRNGSIIRPIDFEHICWRISDIKRGRAAMIGIPKSDDPSKQDLYLIIETATFYEEKYIQIISELNEIYNREIGSLSDYIYIVARGSLPQTSSGKLERYKCKEKILKKSFDVNFIYHNVSQKTIYCKK